MTHWHRDNMHAVKVSTVTYTVGGSYSTPDSTAPMLLRVKEAAARCDIPNGPFDKPG